MNIETQESNVIQTSTATVDFSALEPVQPVDNVDESITSENGNEQLDDEEKELLKLLEGEDSEEPQEPEPEGEPEDKDFEAKFDEHFEKRFGISPEEAVELVQELVQERVDREVRGQLQELQNSWGTDDVETQARLEAVRDFYNTLSPETRGKFNNVKGAQVIWNRIVASGKAPKLTRGKAATPSKGTPSYMYTQSQIDQMPLSEYQQQAQKIAYAYANGLVLKK